MNQATIIALVIMGFTMAGVLFAAGALIDIAHHLRHIARRYGLDE